VILRNVEIGNEPDYYALQHPSTIAPRWNVANYISYWVPTAKALSSIFHFGKYVDEGTTLLVGSFSTFGDDIIWNTQAAPEEGILADLTVAKHAKTFVEWSTSTLAVLLANCHRSELLWTRRRCATTCRKSLSISELPRRQV